MTEALEVDPSGGSIRWRHSGKEIRVQVADLTDAATDPASGLIVALSRSGCGRLLLFRPDGETGASIVAPAGYRLSHLVSGGERLAVVGQGERVQDGWPDWHFLIDGAAGRLERAGPAY